MSCLFVAVILSVGVLVPIFTAPAQRSPSSLLRNLVLDNMPWTVTEKPCDVQCKNGHKLCKNGGICVVTKNCNFKCKCPEGYTGWFCDMKVSTVAAKLPLDLHTSSSSSTLSPPASLSTKRTATTTLSGEKIPLEKRITSLPTPT